MMKIYLYVLLLVASSSMNLLAREVKGPRISFKNMFSFLKIKKKANIGALRLPGQAKGNPKTNSGMLRKIEVPGNKNGKELRVSNLFGFPLKGSHQLMLMKSKGLVAEGCKALSYNRTIQSEGCIPKTVQIKHCSGRCNSFFIPLGHRSFRFCSHCLPIKSKATAISLRCPGKSIKVKIVPLWIIEDCACQSVNSCTY